MEVKTYKNRILELQYTTQLTTTMRYVFELHTFYQVLTGYKLKKVLSLSL